MTGTQHVLSREASPPLLALSVAYAAFAYVSADRGWPALCPFRIVTGHRCPLCGLTTGTGRLLRRDLKGAFAAHWLAPVALPATGIWLAYASLGSGRDGRRGEDRWQRR
jgi:hypothetical protein